MANTKFSQLPVAGTMANTDEFVILANTTGTVTNYTVPLSVIAGLVGGGGSSNAVVYNDPSSNGANLNVTTSQDINITGTLITITDNSSEDGGLTLSSPNGGVAITSPGGVLLVNTYNTTLWGQGGTVVEDVSQITLNSNVISISTNGTFGTNGQVLTSNGSAVFWDTPSSGNLSPGNTGLYYNLPSSNGANLTVTTTGPTTFISNGLFSINSTSTVSNGVGISLSTANGNIEINSGAPYTSQYGIPGISIIAHAGIEIHDMNEGITISGNGASLSVGGSPGLAFISTANGSFGSFRSYSPTLDNSSFDSGEPRPYTTITQSSEMWSGTSQGTLKERTQQVECSNSGILYIMNDNSAFGEANLYSVSVNYFSNGSYLIDAVPWNIIVGNTTQTSIYSFGGIEYTIMLSHSDASSNTHNTQISKLLVVAQQVSEANTTLNSAILNNYASINTGSIGLSFSTYIGNLGLSYGNMLGLVASPSGFNLNSNSSNYNTITVNRRGYSVVT